MQVKIDTNAKKVSKLLGKQGKELSASFRKALSITAIKGMEIIKDRTDKGRDKDGGRFIRYSEKYLNFRANQNKSVPFPKLNFSGKMLGSMTTKANSRRAEIFFAGAEQSAKAFHNDKTRPFFGFSRQEEDRLSKVFFGNLK